MRILIILTSIFMVVSNFPLVEGGRHTNEALVLHQRFIADVKNYYLTNKRIPNRIFQYHRKHYPKAGPIAIVGLGPAGLLATIEAYQNGLAPIYAIEKREIEEYSRDNILRLSQTHFEYIRSLFNNGDSNNPFETAMKEGRIVRNRQGPGLEPLFKEGDIYYTISTKDLEILCSGLLLQLQKHDRRESLHILRGYEFDSVRDNHVLLKPRGPGKNLEIFVKEIVDASGARGIVRKSSDIETVSQSTTGYYSVFTFFMPEKRLPKESIPAVIKTGGRIYQAQYPQYREGVRQLLKNVKRGAPRKNLYQEISLLNPIDKHKNETPLLQASYTTNHVWSERWPGLEMEFVKAGLKDDYRQAVREFQWKPPGKFKRLPVTRFFTNKDLIYIGSEMPKALYDRVNKISDRREKKTLLARWAKFNLRQHLPQKFIDELRIKQFTYFTTSLLSGDEPMGEINGVRVITLGDSWVTPHFFAGSGIGSAIDAVQEWSRFLRNPDKQHVFKKKMQRIKKSTLSKPFNELHKYEIMSPQSQ